MATQTPLRTITVSRQMGSLGSDVACQAAEVLGFRLVWRDLINQAALQAGAPELALAAIDELGLLGICPSPAACQAYRQAVQQIVCELAAKGDAIIIGRAGQAILTGRPDVINVRIVAPFDLRAERISLSKHVTLDAARAQVEASDRFRANYLHRFYQVDWDDPRLYDLVINTARLSVDSAASLVIAIARHWFDPLQATSGSPQDRRLEPSS